MPPRQGELVVGADATVQTMTAVAAALVGDIVGPGAHLVDLARLAVADERPLVTAGLLLLAVTPVLGGHRAFGTVGGARLVVEADPLVGAERRVVVREPGDADSDEMPDAGWWTGRAGRQPGAIAVLDEDGIVVAASPGMARATGRDVASLVGLSPIELVARLDRAVAGALTAAVTGHLLDGAWAPVRLRGAGGDQPVIDDRRRIPGGVLVTFAPSRSLLTAGVAEGATTEVAIHTPPDEGDVDIDLTTPAVTADAVPVDPGYGEVARPDPAAGDMATAQVGAAPPVEVDDLAVAVVVTDRFGRVVHANGPAHQLRGVPPAGLLGLPLTEAVPGSNGGLEDLLETLEREGQAAEEIAVHSGTGETRVYAWTAARHGDGAVLAGVDVTGRHRHTAELAHRAFHDPLTGLANRDLLLERLHHAVVRLDRTDADLAVLFLDLNRFKEVNDTLGHEAGDRLLAGLAERLRSVLRPGDTVARFGGDEFVIVCEEITSAEQVTEIVDRVVAAVEQPFQLAGREARVSVSVGVAMARGTGRDVEALLRGADAAMYRVKGEGRARMVGLAGPLHEGDLRRAIGAGELGVAYQPVIDLRDGHAVSVEALARWRHPERGLLRPDAFLAVAEATGLVVPLGAAVFRQACADAARWAAGSRRLGADAVPVSVNLSLRELGDDGLVDTVAAALEAATLEPGLLRVEVAEHSFVRDPGIALPALRRLSALGVAVVVDDAGLAMPSATSLRSLHLAEVKIEGSAVRRLPSGDVRARAAVEEVAELGRALDLDTVAEGVETDEQLQVVVDLGFDHAQGHVFVPPQPADVIGRLLAAGVRWPVSAPS